MNRVRELGETGTVAGYPWRLSTAARMAVLDALDADLPRYGDSL